MIGHYMVFDDVSLAVEFQLFSLDTLPRLSDLLKQPLSEQKDSLSSSSSLNTANATAVAFAFAFTDGAALGFPPRGELTRWAWRLWRCGFDGCFDDGKCFLIMNILAIFPLSTLSLQEHMTYTFLPSNYRLLALGESLEMREFTVSFFSACCSSAKIESAGYFLLFSCSSWRTGRSRSVTIFSFALAFSFTLAFTLFMGFDRRVS